ncbi:hypothetical protein [Amorphus orientalis]|uniref:Uncharacterized protein n=1 Tax=Amorphus orientalis TaxID=649198 RepID=A0AAE3VMX4_9HYPH|nr:hypothetical protein [Amorphus orientalis]MDQ0314868.1 hypothetical protein [Amorphus orientalis]
MAKAPLVTQAKAWPTRKVIAATVGSALGTAVASILIPPLQSAIPGIMTPETADLVRIAFPIGGTLGLGWLIRSRAGE